MIEPKIANGTADANAELSEKELDGVSGGGTADQTQQIKDVTMNKQKGAQKAADATDAYIRS